MTYHFAAQHFGALSLYRSRADRGSCIQTRRFDRFFALTAGGVLVFVADILAGAVAYQDQWVDRWFPAWIVSAENGIRGGATLALFAITAIMLFVELRTPRWSLPRVLYIVGLAVMVGLALRPRSLFLFLVIWTSQHWILATGLARKHLRRSRLQRLELFADSAQIECAAMGGRAFLMLLSLVFLPIFEVEANRETARTTAIEYLVRLRRSSERQSGCRRSSRSDLRQDSFIICLIEVFIECRTRKCGRQHLA